MATEKNAIVAFKDVLKESHSVVVIGIYKGDETVASTLVFPSPVNQPCLVSYDMTLLGALTATLSASFEALDLQSVMETVAMCFSDHFPELEDFPANVFSMNPERKH
jgi:hypothetical protein